MDYQKVLNLLNESSDSKFLARKQKLHQTEIIIQELKLSMI